MKPTLLIFDQGVGAVRNVHTDLEPYLTDEFTVVYHDWHYTDDEFFEKEKNADIVMTGLDAYYYLKSRFPFEHFKKYIFVSHGYPEFTEPLPEGLAYGMTSYFITHLFPKNTPVFLVKNGVNQNLFPYTERSGDLKIAGWCGRTNFPSKRFPMAVEILYGADLKLHIADGSNGFSRNEMMNWYSTIDVLLITAGPENWCETGPLPAFEAIASGVLVIGTKVGNFSRIPGPKFSTVEEAITILNDLKSHPEKVKEIAKQQYECVMSFWTYEKNAYQWKSMLNHTLAIARSSFQN